MHTKIWLVKNIPFFLKYPIDIVYFFYKVKSIN